MIDILSFFLTPISFKPETKFRIRSLVSCQDTCFHSPSFLKPNKFLSLKDKEFLKKIWGKLFITALEFFLYYKHILI